MVANRIEHKEPIIGVASRVIQGNLYVSREALSCGGLFVLRRIKTKKSRLL